MTMLVALYALLLSACAGTAIEYSEPLCGGTGAALSVADSKDRAFASSWRQRSPSWRSEPNATAVTVVS